MAGAAPLPMRRALLQDLSLPSQPRDRSRPLARSSPTRASGPAVASASWAGSRTPVGRPSRCPPSSSTSCVGLVGATGRVENANDLLIDAGRRPAGRQRGRPAGVLRVGRLPDIEWRARPVARARTGHDGAGGRAPARLAGDAALVPPDAQRRAAGDARPAQPDRPGHRARRPVHRRLRYLGRPQLPRGLRGRGRRRAAERHRATTSSGSWRPTSPPSRSGTRRSASGSPAASWRPSSIGTSATRSSASSSTPATRSTSTSGSTRRSPPGRPIELRSGMALQADVIPATGSDYFTTNIEDAPGHRRCLAPRDVRRRLPGRLGAHRGPPRIHA